MKTIHDHADALVQSLGSRLHVMRESRGWTLDELAERVALSKAYLSRLEAGERQPSIAALAAIAQVFGVSIGVLFERPDESVQCVISRNGSAPAQQANGLNYMPLSSSAKAFNLHPIAVTIPANRAGAETYQHTGEEWLYVAAGRVRLTVGGKQHFLEPGDAAHFDSRLAHRVDALDGHDARIILVACPIPVTLNRGVAGEAEGAAKMAEQFVG